MIVDPRGNIRQTKFSKGKNTESFNPKTTYCRPSMRVKIGNNGKKYKKKLYHDDVILVPNFIEDANEIFNTIVNEINCSNQRDSEFISWHEGCHLIVKNPSGSECFNRIFERICEYFHIEKSTASYRFNYYKDDQDWKSLHHDSAAFNKQRAEHQNITVGLSLGAERELAFKHATNGTLIYFPQEDGMLFSFGKAVNIRYLHGINAIPPELQKNNPRISIIVWGLSNLTIDQPNEPKILEDNDRRNTDTNNQVCRDFQKGRCKWGEKCKFLHKINTSTKCPLR